MIDMTRHWVPELCEVDMPDFVIRLKQINERMGAIESKRKSLIKEVKQGELFFGGIDFDSPSKVVKDSIKKAIKNMRDINEELIELDNEFRDLLTESTIIIEGKFAPLAFKMVDMRISGSLENVLFEPWSNYVEDRESLIKITPESLWFFQLSKKLFDANPANVLVTKESLELIGLK